MNVAGGGVEIDSFSFASNYRAFSSTQSLIASSSITNFQATVDGNFIGA